MPPSLPPPLPPPPDPSTTPPERSGFGLIALVAVGLVVIMATAIVVVVIITSSTTSDTAATGSSAEAVAALDAVVDAVTFDDDGLVLLPACPITRTERLIDDVIARLDDARLDALDRSLPDVTHEAFVIDFPRSGVQLVACERVGTDANFNVVGVSMARAPVDMVAYIEEMSGIDDVEIDDEPDPGVLRGPAIRWICTDTDDVVLRFCEVLWDDQELLVTLYVGGASAARIDRETLRDVVLESLDDWIDGIIR